ncbi:MAG: D-alanyl-D-alanine carboxypeptidase/D-alanyl-D-alanine-endopeptidase [Paludibacteraceae bacterium]|nr:D-alanyl-D-alanine carboxypeptidase/D-alanyl-D-alanine-endopeptidase [Paludibacteraceae bacterium]
MKKFFFTTLLFSFIVSNIVAQPFFNKKGMESASIAYVVKNLKTGNIVHQQNNLLSFTPASVTKLITTATALEILGKDFTFKTYIEYDGVIENGTLKGNLYIRGGGDPTLGSYKMGDPRFMQSWAKIIKSAGINAITGAIVADVSLYDQEGVSPKWLWEDIANYYAPSIFALSIYDNTCRVMLRSGAEGSAPEVISHKPFIEDMILHNHLVVKNIKSDSAYFYGSPLSNERYLFGAVPINKKEFIIKGDIPNLPMFFAKEMDKNLRNIGIKIAQQPKVLFKKENTNRKVIHCQHSPKLSRIIQEINVKSNNVYAEHLFKYLSLQKNNVAHSAVSIGVVKSFWKQKGLNTESLFLQDGSGLSPKNKISAQFFVDLLCYMRRSENFEAFYNSLPVAGESGTIRQFLSGTALSGNVKAKSGSFDMVQCYAGYMSDSYAFAVLTNNFYCPRREIVREIERLLTQSIR